MSSHTRGAVDVFVLEFVVNLRWALRTVLECTELETAHKYPQFMLDARETLTVLDQSSYASVRGVGALPLGALELARRGALYLLLSESIFGLAPVTLHAFLLGTPASGNTSARSSAVGSRHRRHQGSSSVGARPETANSHSRSSPPGNDGMVSSTDTSASPSLDLRTVDTVTSTSSFPHTSVSREDSECQAMLILMRWLYSFENPVVDMRELLETLQVPQEEIVDPAGDGPTERADVNASIGVFTKERRQQRRKRQLFRLHTKCATRLAQLSPFYLGAHVVLLRAFLIHYTTSVTTVMDIQQHIRRLQSKAGHRQAADGALPASDDTGVAVEDTLVSWLRAVLATIVADEQSDDRGLAQEDVLISACASRRLRTLRTGVEFYGVLSDGFVVATMIHAYQPRLITRNMLLEMLPATTTTTATVRTSRVTDPMDLPPLPPTSANSLRGRRTQHSIDSSTIVSEHDPDIDCEHVWTVVIEAARQLRVHACFTPGEVSRVGREVLPLHLLRFVQELFVILATDAEETVRSSYDSQREEVITSTCSETQTEFEAHTHTKRGKEGVEKTHLHGLEASPLPSAEDPGDFLHSLDLSVSARHISPAAVANRTALEEEQSSRWDAVRSSRSMELSRPLNAVAHGRGERGTPGSSLDQPLSAATESTSAQGTWPVGSSSPSATHFTDDTGVGDSLTLSAARAASRPMHYSQRVSAKRLDKSSTSDEAHKKLPTPTREALRDLDNFVYMSSSVPILAVGRTDPVDDVVRQHGVDTLDAPSPPTTASANTSAVMRVEAAPTATQVVSALQEAQVSQCDGGHSPPATPPSPIERRGYEPSQEAPRPSPPELEDDGDAVLPSGSVDVDASPSTSVTRDGKRDATRRTPARGSDDIKRTESSAVDAAPPPLMVRRFVMSSDASEVSSKADNSSVAGSSAPLANSSNASEEGRCTVPEMGAHRSPLRGIAGGSSSSSSSNPSWSRRQGNPLDHSEKNVRDYDEDTLAVGSVDVSGHLSELDSFFSSVSRPNERLRLARDENGAGPGDPRVDELGEMQQLRDNVMRLLEGGAHGEVNSEELMVAVLRQQELIKKLTADYKSRVADRPRRRTEASVSFDEESLQHYYSSPDSRPPRSQSRQDGRQQSSPPRATTTRSAISDLSGNQTVSTLFQSRVSENTYANQLAETDISSHHSGSPGRESAF